MMHPVYLPFTEQQLLSHFAGNNSKHLDYYKKSIDRYDEYCANNPVRKRNSLFEMRLPCQIEKDERFWIAAAMMTLFYSQNRTEQLTQLFKNCYGEAPPISGINSWEECLDGELHLFFEANLPSPPSYKSWLAKNLRQRQAIPYILDSADGKKNLEGATNVDALLINSINGFAVITEAKVLSDISYGVIYDTMRNQIARNIDVMLDTNNSLDGPLNKRDSDKTLFLLITPMLYKNNPTSRLYGYKLNDYKNHPPALANDLPHRTGCDWQDISRRLGWLTWENLNTANPDCCKWLDTGGH